MKGKSGFGSLFSVIGMVRNDAQASRTSKVKKNIFSSIIYKGFALPLSLISTPLIISIFGSERYGVWITLSSIIAWFSFFDIGLGHGLRNKLAAALAQNDLVKAKKYVSTTYAAIGVVSLGLFCLFFTINQIVDWASVLNVSYSLDPSITMVPMVIVTFFCVQFFLKLLSVVLVSTQKSSATYLFELLTGVVGLAGVFLLTWSDRPALTSLALVLSAAPVVVLFMASIYYYKTELVMLAPTIKSIDWKLSGDILGLGYKYLFLQLTFIVFTQTDNIIIARLFGMEEVTVFNVGFKLFSLLIMGFSILISPLWTAFTDAYESKDWAWIKNVNRKSLQLWIGFTLLTFIIFLCSPVLFRWWMGDKVVVPMSLSAALAFYVVSFTWHQIHVTLLNGTGKLVVQLMMVLVCGLVNIPLAIILGKSIGLPGITLANAVLFVIMGTVYYIQGKKITDQTADGIWNR